MEVNTGDTAWILISSALVLLMTPGLALFYGGMARRKNLLSTIMMSFAIMGLVGIIWALWGYSFSFGSDNGGFIGGLNFLGFLNVGMEPSETYASSVPHLAFMAFQGMFAIITVALITGAVVERIKFSALLIFSALWVTVVYGPVAHRVWGEGGWLGGLGALDFAGGAVVHINAGVSALALVLLLGRRRGFPGDTMEANNIPMVALAAAGFTWMVISWLHHRPSLLGTVTGAVAGLVAITPAAGFVAPIAAIPIGIVVSFVCYYSIVLIKSKLKFDDSLDVFAVHGMGGIWGALATGIFASSAIGGASGLIEGNWGQVGIQAISILSVAAFAFVVTWILGKLVDVTVGLRVGQSEETVGLDLAQHGERAYGGLLR
jgi:Amt family ammonium transporter